MPGPTTVVTGGAGFIGSHLVDLLLAEGRDVVVFDDLSSGRAENVPDGATLIPVDVSAGEQVEAAFDDLSPVAVYHLAAQASVVASVSDPARDCRINVLGTLNVARAATSRGLPLVFASSGGAIYGAAAPRPTPEQCPAEPVSPYGMAKLAAEGYVLGFGRSSGAPAAVCRLANVYGPRQSAEGEAGVVAVFSALLARDERPTLYGHGLPTRDYVYVADAVSALRVAEGRSGVYNVSTGVATPVLELFETLRELAGAEIEPLLAPLRPGELEHSSLDPALARLELGWSPSMALLEGLALTYHTRAMAP